MTHMDYMWSPAMAANKGCRCEVRPAESPADLDEIPRVPPGVALAGAVVILAAMAFARLRRPARLPRGSIWWNPVTGNATLYR